MAKMVVDYQGSSKNDECVYTFAYNNHNQLTNASVTINGRKPTQLNSLEIGDAVHFIKASGRLTRV